MSLAPKVSLSLAALALIGVGAALWAQYGGLVYFDTLAAAFVGCFF
jgi:hypothetical protein